MRVEKNKLFIYIIISPVWMKTQLWPSDERKLVKMFRNKPETTKAQACHELEPAESVTVHCELSFTSLWTERLLTKK